MDRIVLRGMRFEGRHGVSDEERATPQLLEADLEIEADLETAGRSDRIEDTVDYGPLIELARRAIEGRSQRLLEAIASSIADDALSSDPRIVSVTVRVRKLAVPVDADLDHAEVELHRSRTA
jgi:7,8-dihydroneopterin aldolase/epimerase/oxygenase